MIVLVIQYVKSCLMLCGVVQPGFEFWGRNEEKNIDSNVCFSFNLLDVFTIFLNIKNTFQKNEQSLKN